MQEKIKKLNDLMQEQGVKNENEFSELAKEIAITCIDSFYGKLLEKGLAVAKAVADFGAEIQSVIDE